LFAGGPFRFGISVEKAYLPEAVMGQNAEMATLIRQLIGVPVPKHH
jgi:hypothetical protein